MRIFSSIGKYIIFNGWATVKLLATRLAMTASLGGLITLTTLLPPSIAQAQQPTEESIPRGWESYRDRTDIFSVSAIPQDLGPSWENLRQAHFSFVAELLELYPENVELVFLARDSEYIYDVARLVTAGTKDESRVHLANISRGSMRDPKVLSYLAEFGLTEANLRAGRQFLFIDTGFAGTIPRVLGENFSKEALVNLRTHLLVSKNQDHPSSRAFLVHINPSVNRKSTADLHGTIISYEHMAREMGRATKYELLNGSYHPLSSTTMSPDDGEVSKEKSLRYRQDLRAAWIKPNTQKRFREERAQMNKVVRALSDWSAANSTEAISTLRTQLEEQAQTDSGRLLEAQIRDAVDLLSKRDPEAKLLLAPFNLKPVEDGPRPNKYMFIQQHPDWAPYLENPDQNIPPLFAEGQWQMVGNLVDANVDDEINRILIKYLYAGPATGPLRQLQETMIDNANSPTLKNIIEYGLAHPKVREMTDLVQLIIESNNTAALNALARKTMPHLLDRPDLVRALIAKGDFITRDSIAQHVLAADELKDRNELIRFFIDQTSEARDLGVLAEVVFSRPSMSGERELLHYYMEKCGAPCVFYLARNVFSQEHSKDKPELVSYLLSFFSKTSLKANLKTSSSANEIPLHQPEMDAFASASTNNRAFRYVLKFVFEKEFWINHPGWLKFLREEASPLILEDVAYDLLSLPSSANQTELLDAIVRTPNQAPLRTLATRVFSKYFHSQQKELLKVAVERAEAEDEVLRQRIYADFLVGVFKEEHSKDKGEILEYLIDRVDRDTLERIVPGILAMKHWQHRDDLVAKVLQRGNRLVRAQMVKHRLIQNVNLRLNQLAQPITENLHPEDRVLIEGRPYTVLKYIDQGRRGAVFQVRSEQGSLHALKVAKTKDPKNLESLAKEAKKEVQWQQIKIPHAAISATGTNFVLKEWIEGQRGDEVLNRAAAGDNNAKIATEELLHLVNNLRSQGVYIGDFRPANLIWTGQQWVLVDSGTIKQNLSSEEAQAKWSSSDERGPKFLRRWQLALPDLATPPMSSTSLSSPTPNRCIRALQKSKAKFDSNH